jgi:hypothetical protein
MSIAVMVAGRAGRPSSRLRYREVAHLTLRALHRGRRAGSSVARTARPIVPDRSAGPSGQIPVAVSWSLAASIAVVKLARSGSVPGRVSMAVDHGHAQQLVEGERGPGFLFQAGPVTRAQHMAIERMRASLIGLPCRRI